MLENCKVKYSYGGIKCTGIAGMRVEIKKSTITANGWVGIVINDNNIGDAANLIEISSSTISQNSEGGIWLNNGGNVRIERNDIKNNGGKGIQYAGVDINDTLGYIGYNTVEHNVGGISVTNASPLIENNQENDNGP